MSYKTELQANNTDLQAILDTVNALPEAGGALKTCTMTFKCNYVSSFESIHYTKVVDGSLVNTKVSSPSGMTDFPVTITDVLCSSIVGVHNILFMDIAAATYDKGDAEVIVSGGADRATLFKAPSVNGINVTATIYDDM